MLRVLITVAHNGVETGSPCDRFSGRGSKRSISHLQISSAQAT
jgi:hypothetical protein